LCNDRDELRNKLIEINNNARNDRNNYRSKIDSVTNELEKVKIICNKRGLSYTNSRKDHTALSIKLMAMQRNSQEHIEFITNK
jgi:hypothetical protein